MPTADASAAANGKVLFNGTRGDAAMLAGFGPVPAGLVFEGLVPLQTTPVSADTQAVVAAILNGSPAAGTAGEGDVMAAPQLEQSAPWSPRPPKATDTRPLPLVSGELPLPVESETPVLVTELTVPAESDEPTEMPSTKGEEPAQMVSRPQQTTVALPAAPVPTVVANANAGDVAPLTTAEPDETGDAASGRVVTASPSTSIAKPASVRPAPVKQPAGAGVVDPGRDASPSTTASAVSPRPATIQHSAGVEVVETGHVASPSTTTTTAASPRPAPARHPVLPTATEGSVAADLVDSGPATTTSTVTTTPVSAPPPTAQQSAPFTPLQQSAVAGVVDPGSDATPSPSTAVRTSLPVQQAANRAAATPSTTAPAQSPAAPQPVVAQQTAVSATSSSASVAAPATPVPTSAAPINATGAVSAQAVSAPTGAGLNADRDADAEADSDSAMPRTADVAGLVDDAPAVALPQQQAGWKKILLNAYKQRVKPESESVGIKDAKPDGIMPTLLTTPFATVETTAAAAPATTASSSIPAEWAEKLAQLTARADRLAPARLEVSLPMDGAADLRVRVSCRGGRVSCEFQNVSTEMQNVFLRDWPGLAQLFGRDNAQLRIEQPTFVNLNDPQDRPGGDQSNRRQRDEHAARDEDEAIAAFFAAQRQTKPRAA